MMTIVSNIRKRLAAHPLLVSTLFLVSCIGLVILSWVSILYGFGVNPYVTSYVRASTTLSGLVGSNSLLFWSAEIVALILGILLAIRWRSRHDGNAGWSMRKLDIAIVAVSLAIVAASITSIVLSRLDYSLISGGDTLVYTDYVRVMQSNGPSWAFLMTDRPLFYIGLFAIAQFVDVRSAIYWAAVAGIVSVAFLVSTGYLLLRADASRWRVSGFVVIAATSVSPLFMRLNADIFSSELGLAVALFMFGIYISSNPLRAIHRTLLVAAAVCLLFLYWYLLLLSAIGLGIIAQVQHRRRRELSGMLAPSLSLFAFFIALAILVPPPQYWGIGSGVVGLFAKGSLPPWIPKNLPSAPLTLGPSSESIKVALGSRDLVFMGLTVAVTMIASIIRPKGLAIFVGLSTSAGLGLMFFTPLSLHAATFLPGGIIATGSLLSLSGPRRTLTSVVLLLVLMLPLQTAMNYQFSYIEPLQPPSPLGLQQLAWIDQHIGFGNTSYVLAIQDHYDYLWALALGLQTVYYGSVASAITGSLDPSIVQQERSGSALGLAGVNDYIGATQRLWAFGISLPLDTPEHRLILTTDTYRPDPFEMQHLISIGPGIYQLELSNATRLKSFAEDWLFWKSTGNIDRLLTNSKTDSLTINDTALWQAPSSAVKLEIGSNNGKGMDIFMNVGAGNTEYAIYQVMDSLNITSTPVVLSMDVNSTVPVQLAIVLQNSANFRDYYSLRWGSISGEATVQVVLSPDNMSSFGSPSPGNIRYLSINAFSNEACHVTIAVSYIA